MRMSIAIFLAAGILLANQVPHASAGNQPCANQESQAAEAVAATASTWEQLHQQFKLYGHCDDGAVAEGFSEVVSLLLVERWGYVHGLDVLSAADPDFRKFVIHHIDETVPSDRLIQIRKNSATQCPDRLKTLCHDIEVAAMDALNEQ